MVPPERSILQERSPVVAALRRQVRRMHGGDVGAAGRVSHAVRDASRARFDPISALRPRPRATAAGERTAARAAEGLRPVRDARRSELGQRWLEAAVTMLVILFFMEEFDAGHYVERLGI